MDTVTTQIERRGVTDPATLDAMREVPREEFVPANMRAHTREDRALPIGHQQTISQPFIVAAMTEALQLRPSDRVLEIGTGSGYQAAVLSRIVNEVYTIEIIPELAESATKRLQNYPNVNCRIGDGYHGWLEEAPFDKIIVTAACLNVPEQLVLQLTQGGRMVLPIGAPNLTQTLTVAIRHGDDVSTTGLMAVKFVPFTRL